MRLVTSEQEPVLRSSRFIKAELKRAGLTYADVAERLRAHGLPSETEASIKGRDMAAMARSTDRVEPRGR